MKAILIIVIISLFSLVSCFSQEYNTNSKKAIKLCQEAEHLLDAKMFDKAIKLIEEATKEDNNFIEAWILLADANDYINSYNKVIESCNKAKSINPDKYPIIYFYLANSHFKLTNYSEALNNAIIFLEKKQYTASQQRKAELIKASCLFAIEALKNPVPFNPENIGNTVNTKYDEYWPSLSADEEFMVFARQIPKNKNNPIVFNNRQEDIYSTIFQEGKWQEAVPVSPNINTPDNEGAPFVSSNGKYIFLTICRLGEGCDIYISELQGDKWTKPVNIGEPINSGANEKQPSLSSDGKTLYFSSNRPKGKGLYDIWASTLDSTGKWNIPVNLGDSVNTQEVEESPFIHPDNQTLYFSSSGWPGMGGSDLFYTKKIDNEKSWSKAKNLGYPINTSADETGLIINSKGNHAYYASDRDSNKGRDIYEFELYKEARPISVTYMKGRIKDKETQQVLEATFEIINQQSSEIVNESKSSKYTGEFLVCIPANKNYAINVSKPGYLFYSESFTIDTNNDITKPYLLDIDLFHIKQGYSVVLKNIFFETNSYTLKSESTAELNELLQFLKNNKSIRIEIGGHTDNVGSDEFNQKLSENRAKVVAEFLLKNKIPAAQITYKGYGKSKPITNNNSEQNRAQNRRTEFKIL